MASGERNVAVVVPCSDIERAIAYYRDNLGFHVIRIAPAEAPKQALIGRDGLVLCLDSDYVGPAPRIRMEDGAGPVMSAPDGVVIERHPPRRKRLPPLAPTLCQGPASPKWTRGRAGMLYRDLIGDRQGGRFVASHIRIDEGGPVADYVHHHDIRFQMIHCVGGWVRLVYEGQGEPFVLRDGDTVLQPPGIRHQVLESSDGLEVVELTSPASHDTFGDHMMDLPGPRRAAENTWAGQRFVRSMSGDASWSAWRWPQWSVRCTGIAEATEGLASVSIAKHTGDVASSRDSDEHDGELLFWFVRHGRVVLECDGERSLGRGTSIVLPPKQPFRLVSADVGAEILEVRL